MHNVRIKEKHSLKKRKSGLIFRVAILEEGGAEEKQP